MIYVFIDESEDNSLFVVGGVATIERDKLLDGIFETRRYIKSKKGLSQKQKSQLLNELKDFVLNGSFEDIKSHFIRNIVFEKVKSTSKEKNGNWYRREYNKIFCLYYRKKQGEYFNQKRKEDVYKSCVMKVLEVLEPFGRDLGSVKLIYDITYDQFGEGSFGDQLKAAVKERVSYVTDIRPGKSNEVKELQAADVCIGCMRRSFHKEDLDNFEVLKDSTIMIEVDLPYDPLKYRK